MPFTIVVDASDSASELHGFPDSDRAQAEGLIAEFRAGVRPLDDTLTVHHAHGVFRKPWHLIRDIWIEEVR